MITKYYRGAHAALVIFDITKSDSFLKAQNWVRELKQKASSEIIIALVGNKIDLNEKREVGFNEGQCYAEDNGLLFIEVSAKSGQNIYELFASIVRMATDSNKNEPIQQVPLSHTENSNNNNCC